MDLAMTALPQDVVADLKRRIAELEQQLQSGAAGRDEALAREAVAATEVDRLQAELHTARDRQHASAEILRTIASAPGDAARSLQQIAETSARLFGAPSVSIQLVEDGEWGEAYRFGDSAQRIRTAVPLAQIRVGGQNLPGAVVGENRQIHVPDLDRLDPSVSDFPGLPHARASGTRTMCGTPLRREGKAIGVLIVYRDRLLPFTEEELALQQSFADQAVIAIQNARLFNETKEALERQTATADILKVIASSPSDVQPVFDVIVERAVHLCGGHMGRVYRYDGDVIQMVAGHGLSVPGLDKVQQVFPRPAAGDTTAGLAIRSRRPYFVTDIKSDQSVPELSRQMIEALGTRSQVTVPMLRAGEPIGAITVGWASPGAYGDQQVMLLQSFADQAVIAIENARLFNETREALERQTATADILKVIASSPSDAQPVFEAIARSAKNLLGGFSSTVFHFVDGIAHLKAFTPTTPAADNILTSTFPRPAADFSPFRMAQVGEITQIPDTEALSDDILGISRARGFRSMLFAPLMNNGASIGFIAVTRVEPGTFAGHHVQLLKTFSDQAVIAIENARLFNEVQERTRELSESLQFQTASAEVLKVISRSPDTLQPVLDVIVETSRELCSALTAVIFLLRDGKFHDVAESSTKPAYIEALRANPIPLNQVGSALARAAREKRTIHIPNTAEDPECGLGGPLDQGGPRSLLSVPLIHDGRVIGGIMLRQSHLAPFTPRQIEAVETFADQAVIAISNVNLFEQVQERTRELAKSLDELRAAQDRLIQTEKLASLGQLTAGIAHEIKNPLNFVNNFAALSGELIDELNEALGSVAVPDKTRGEVDELTGLLKDNLQKVVQHGKRADSIVKNMLLHSREGSGEHRPADINALVDESLNLAYHGARAEKPQFNVRLERDFDPTAGMIEVFPQDITRVFLNLISNGFYAVTKRKTENGGAGFEPLVTATTKARGDRVEIRIRDNGTGIAPEVKEKMFNPFFTTKPPGEGTGLGLSMSHDIIVKQHGGTIEVDSAPGEFTEFTIVLPRTSNVSNKARG
jgi:two-component system, NtrC family, sensor kinase